jgi:hypothetical protein
MHFPEAAIHDAGDLTLVDAEFFGCLFLGHPVIENQGEHIPLQVVHPFEGHPDGNDILNGQFKVFVMDVFNLGQIDIIERQVAGLHRFKDAIFGDVHFPGNVAK